MNDESPLDGHVEAIRVGQDGEFTVCPEWLTKSLSKGIVSVVDGGWEIKTPLGVQLARPGDWILFTGWNGELFTRPHADFARLLKADQHTAAYVKIT
jgi:hypothetical protein